MLVNSQVKSCCDTLLASASRALRPLEVQDPHGAPWLHPQVRTTTDTMDELVRKKPLFPHCKPALHLPGR